MNIQIKLSICRSCLKPSDSTKLVEVGHDSTTVKNFLFLIDREPSSELPRTFCEKCITKIDICSNFKRTGLASEDYLKSFLKKINLEFEKSLPNLNANRKEPENEDYELFFDDPLTESTENSNKTAEEQPAKPEVQKIEKSAASAIVTQKKQQQVNAEPKVEEPMKEYLEVDTEALYTEEEQLEDNDGMFSEEIYDIMEIEGNGNENIYLDETGKQVLGEEDNFILVNFKSSEEDLSEKDGTYAVIDDAYDETSSPLDQKPQAKRKKHIRMPKELIARYAQSNDNNQHICTKCNKTFSTRTNLIRHIQSHDGYKAYVCTICNKGFTQSGSLKQHMYIHTGERPYKCEFCSREFTQGKTLKFHLRRHTEEKPFICEYCNSNFRQRDGLKRHLKAKHQVELKYERKASTNEKVFLVKIDQDAGNNTDTTINSQQEASEAIKS